MEDVFPIRAARVLLVVVLVGVFLGVLIAIRESRRPPRTPTSGIPEAPVFSTYFVEFFPVRSRGGSPRRGEVTLVPAGEFGPGERVSVYVRTTTRVRKSFRLEVRILRSDTHEEVAALRDLRQEVRIRPGSRAYCCLRLPTDPGVYELAAYVGDQFVTTVPITVRSRSRR